MLTYEEFIAIKIPITKNFYWSDKDLYDTSETEQGNELFETEEKNKRIVLNRNFFIAIGLFVSVALIISAIVLIVLNS